MSPSPAPRKSRKVLIIVLVVLALIAAGIAAAWFMMAPKAPTLKDVGTSFGQNDVNAAIGQADAILVKNPNDVSALVAKSIALSQKGSLEFKEDLYGPQAAAVATRATEIDPQSSEAWRALAYANEIMQNYGDAHRFYERSLSFDPQNARSLFSDAHIYDLQGDAARAETGYRAAIAADANYDQPHGGLGRVLAAKGDIQGATTELTAAYTLATNPHNKAEAAYSLAIISKAGGDLAKARTYAEEATTLDATYPFGWYGLGTVLLSQATVPSAAITLAERGALIKSSIAALNAAISLNPNQSVAYVDLASGFLLFGKPDVALDILAKAEEIVPSDITLNAADKASLITRITSLRDTVKSVQARAKN